VYLNDLAQTVFSPTVIIFTEVLLGEILKISPSLDEADGCDAAICRRIGEVDLFEITKAVPTAIPESVLTSE
jgi:hypothetical protein